MCLTYYQDMAVISIWLNAPRYEANKAISASWRCTITNDLDWKSNKNCGGSLSQKQAWLMDLTSAHTHTHSIRPQLSRSKLGCVCPSCWGCSQCLHRIICNSKSACQHQTFGNSAVSAFKADGRYEQDAHYNESHFCLMQSSTKLLQVIFHLILFMIRVKDTTF